MRSIREVARRLMTRTRPPLRCSACGRAKGQWTQLLSGPGVYLCNVCIRDATTRDPSLGSSAAPAVTCRFCGRFRSPVAYAHTVSLPCCAECMRTADAVLSEDDERRRPAT